jgi:hypothetical protein
MTDDPDDPRYTTVHGGVQIPNTHDPMLDGIPQTSTSRPAPTGQRDVGPSVAPAGEEIRGTHDPMLDGITRWDTEDVMYAEADRRACYPPNLDEENEWWVKWSDLPALLAAAREDERGKSLGVGRWVDGADGVARWHHAGSTTQTSAPEAASLLSAAPVPPTSVAPAGEDYGALRWVTEADYDSAIESAREQGQRDEREAAARVVEGLLNPLLELTTRTGTVRSDAAAAIRAREEKS